MSHPLEVGALGCLRSPGPLRRRQHAVGIDVRENQFGAVQDFEPFEDAQEFVSGHP